MSRAGDASEKNKILSRKIRLHKMNLRSTLLAEHSKQQCDYIVRWIGNDPEKFDELFTLFLHDEWQVVQRSAWPVCLSAIKYPSLVEKHIEQLLDKMQQAGVHDAVKRNGLKLLSLIVVAEAHHGKLMDFCFKALENLHEPVAVKAFSITILGNLGRLYPDIIPEAMLLIEDQMDGANPGFVSRARKFLKEFGK